MVKKFISVFILFTLIIGFSSQSFAQNDDSFNNILSKKNASINILLTDIEDLKQQLSNTLLENDRLNKKVQEYSTYNAEGGKLISNENEINELTLQKKALVNQLTEVRQEKLELQQKIKDLVSDIKELSRISTNNRPLDQDELNAQKLILNGLRAKNEELMTLIDLLNSENEELKSNVKLTQSQISELKAELKTVKNQKITKSSQSKNSISKKEINQLKDQITSLKAKNKALLNTTAKSEESNLTNDEEMALLQQKNKELSKKLLNKDLLIDQKNRINRVTLQERDELKQENAELLAKINNSTNVKDVVVKVDPKRANSEKRLKEKVSILEEKLITKSDQISALKEEHYQILKKAKQEIIKLDQKYSDYRKKSEPLASVNQKQIKEIESLKRKISNLNKNVVKLEVNNKSKKDANKKEIELAKQPIINEKNQILEQLKEAKKAHKTEIDQLTAKFEKVQITLRAKIEEVKSLVENEKQVSTDLQKQVKVLSDEKIKLNQKVSLQESSLIESENQLKLVKENSKKALESSIKGLKTEKINLSKQEKDNKELIKALEDEINNKTSKVQSLEKENKTLQNENNQANNKLKLSDNKNKELEKSIPTAISNASKTLKEEIRQLKNKIDLQSNEIKSSKIELENYASKLDLANIENKNNIINKKKIEAELSKVNQELKLKEKSIQLKEAEIQKEKTLTKKLSTEKDQTSKINSKLQNDLALLNQKIGSMNKEVALKVKEAKKPLVHNIDVLKSDLKDSELKSSKLKDELNTAAITISSLKDGLNKLKEENLNLLNTQISMKKELDDSKNKFQLKNTDLTKQLNSVSISFKEEVGALKADLSKKSEELVKANAGLKEISDKFNAISKVNVQLEQGSKELSKKSVDQNKEIIQLSNNLDKLIIELNDSKKNNQKLVSQISSIEQKVIEANDEKKNINDKANLKIDNLTANYKQQIEVLNIKVAQMSEKLKSLTQNLNTSKSEASDSYEKLTKIKSKYHDLIVKNEKLLNDMNQLEQNHSVNELKIRDNFKAKISNLTKKIDELVVENSKIPAFETELSERNQIISLEKKKSEEAALALKETVDSLKKSHIAQLELVKANHSNEIIKLNTQLSSLQKIADDKDALIENQKKYSEELKLGISTLEKQLEKDNKRLMDLSARYENAENELLATKGSIPQEIKKSIAPYLSEIKALQANLSQSNDKLKLSQSKVQALSTNLNLANQNSKDLQEQMNQLVKKIDNNSIGYDNKISTLKEDHKQELEQLKSQLLDNNENLVKTTAANKELLAHSQLLQEELRLKEENITSLENDKLSALNKVEQINISKNEELSNLKISHANEISQFKTKIDSLLKINNEHNITIQEALSKNAKLTEDYRISIKKQETLKSNLSETNQKLKEASINNEETIATLSAEQTQKLSQLNSEKKNLKGLLQSEKEKTQELLVKQNELTSLTEELTKNVNEATVNLNKVQNELELTKTSIPKLLESQKTPLLESIELLTAKTQSLEKSIPAKINEAQQPLKTKITSLEMELMDSKKEVKEKKDRIVKLEESESNLMKKVNLLSAEKSKITQNFQLTNNQLKQAEQVLPSKIEEIKIPLQTSIRFLERKLLESESQLKELELKLHESEKIRKRLEDKLQKAQSNAGSSLENFSQNISKKDDLQG